MESESQPDFLSTQVLDSEYFYGDLNPSEAHKLTIVCGGWERCMPDYRIRRNGFPFYGLELVTGGLGQLHLGNREFPLHRGVVFSYGPQHAHSITTDSGQRLEKFFLDLTGKAGLELLRAAGLPPGTCRNLGDAGEIHSTWKTLIREGKLSRPHTPRITTLLLEILLLQVADATAFEKGHEQSHQTFLKCRRWMDEHCLEITTAEEAASACHLHPAYLTRLFTRYGNETPYRYLMRRKMTHAAHMLASGSHIVREVAELLEMDAFHFSKVFKRIHGVPPSQLLKSRNG